MKSLFLTLSLLVLSPLALADRFIVKLKNKSDISKIEKKYDGRISVFTKTRTKYFDNVYYLSSKRSDLIVDLKQDEMLSYAESIVDIKAKSIVTHPHSQSRTNDPLYPYQWGLDFQNQTVLNEVTDILNKPILGNSHSDINTAVASQIDEKMKREVLVAVIDSGIDFKHPDLSKNIYRNEAECEGGEIPWGDLTDKDSNGYAGDCMGWDFTGAGDVGDNRPEDSVGHGTHVAGIIAAVSGNNEGVSGLSNKIKILPVKVLSNKASDSQALGASDRLARAILYAVNMKVDVINLSLGWPISFDKKHLQDAVKEAIASDITVIAAAGNNDHSAPIFPCAYDKVICVGATDPDSHISDFSNFGGHVDVLAPGNNILSTYPTDETPLYFDIKGYEVKSGTSQSAPFVSGLAAIIKGSYPGITENSLKQRVFAKSRSNNRSRAKYTAFGSVNFNDSLGSEVKSFYAPVFKSLGRVKVDYKSKTFTLPVTLRKYGESATLKSVSFKSSEHIVFENEVYDVDTKDESITLTLKGTFSSLNVDFKQNLYIRLTSAKGVRKFQNEFSYYVDAQDIPGVISKSISGALSKEILGLSTVYLNHMDYSSINYYATQEAGDRGIIFSLFNSDESRIFKAGMAMIRNAKRILSVHRLDMNFDGVEDYMIRSFIETGADDEKVQSIQYSYFTNKMRPLFGNEKDSNWKVKFEKVILQDFDDFSLVPFVSEKFGKILIPAFLAVGPTPAANRNPNPFFRLYKKSFVQNLYYYLPEQVDGQTQLTLQTINTITFNNKFKKMVGFKPFERIFFLKFLKQSFKDIKSGRFDLLVSVEGRKSFSRNFLLRLTDLISVDWSLKSLKSSSRLLSKYHFDRTIDLSADKNIAHIADLGLSASYKSDEFLWEQKLIFNESSRIEYVSQQDKANPLQIPIKTYVDGDKSYQVFQAPSSLFFKITEGSDSEVIKYPVHVSSFLPGVLFREQNYPIVYKDNGRSLPALYVDATQIASRNIYTIIAKEEKVIAPIALNIDVPKLCKPKNPQVLEDGHTYYSMLCFFNRGSEKMLFIRAGGK